MKTRIIATLTFGILAGPALAGGPTLAEAEPAPMAAAPMAAAHDWSGTYVGLSYGRTSGSSTFTGPDFFYDLEDGSAVGAYAGYLWQRNNLVYGAELAYSNLNDTLLSGFYEEVTDALDVKARLGFASNRVLMYGVLGWSEITYDAGFGDVADFSGMNYGIGVDYAVTNRLGLGLEYLIRDVDGDSLNGGGQTQQFDLNTLSLRIGFSF